MEMKGSTPEQESWKTSSEEETEAMGSFEVNVSWGRSRVEIKARSRAQNNSAFGTRSVSLGSNFVSIDVPYFKGFYTW